MPRVDGDLSSCQIDSDSRMNWRTVGSMASTAGFDGFGWVRCIILANSKVCCSDVEIVKAELGSQPVPLLVTAYRYSDTALVVSGAQSMRETGYIEWVEPAVPTPGVVSR